MKKVKKNNKPIIILIVGLLVFGSVIGFSVFKMNEHKKMVYEHHENFEKEKAAKKDECTAGIAASEKAIEGLEADIDAIEKEIVSLQRQKTEEFMNSSGRSDKYYALEDQITEKRKEQSKKSAEIFKKKKEITDYNSTIWEIENDFGDYRYKQPNFQNSNAYFLMGLGVVGCIATVGAAGISQLVKTAASEKSFSEYNEIDEGALSRVNVNDGALLKKELFGKLESLLLASSKEDYDTIRKLCTKNMARSYIDEVELLKKHKQKLVIKDVSNEGCKIVNAYNTQHNTKVSIVVKVKLYNYTKDVTTNEIISGDDKKKTEQAFKLVFVKDFVKGHDVKKCPNCGANIKDATRVDCSYCGTVFDNSNYDWYLESKVIISED